MKLNGSHIVVTGAAGGIGKALARRFHAGAAEPGLHFRFRERVDHFAIEPGDDRRRRSRGRG